MPGAWMKQIRARTGRRVDAIQYTHVNGRRFGHGGGGGGERTLNLAPGEYVTEVRVSTVRPRWRSRRLSSIEIVTNLGNVLRGGRVKGVTTFSAGPGRQIVGFHGRSGKEIDRLGVITAAVPQTLPAGLHR